MTFNETMEYIGRGLEAVGVAIIVIGIAASLIALMRQVTRGGAAKDAFIEARKDIGRSILFGLEVLVAGDIVLTVAVSPTFTSVGVLAAIVLIRTFLSFTLEVEIDGLWPWQKDREPASSRTV